ncbi:MAG TPA: ATP-dependent helicase, partial [Bacteroidia bacterium]|nr:ATP-dependent helicase [Bacteroidia bacterium]
ALSFVIPAEKEKQKEIEELMNKKIPILTIPSDVEISDELTTDEIPVKKDKNINKNSKKGKKLVPTNSAFAEKKEKNKKVNLGGARRRENQRRKLEKSISKRGNR